MAGKSQSGGSPEGNGGDGGVKLDGCGFAGYGNKQVGCGVLVGNGQSKGLLQQEGMHYEKVTGEDGKAKDALVPHRNRIEIFPSKRFFRELREGIDKMEEKLDAAGVLRDDVSGN